MLTSNRSAYIIYLEKFIVGGRNFSESPQRANDEE